jgi:hypothetical protein
MSACLHPGDSWAKCSLMHDLMRPPPGSIPLQNCFTSCLQAASGPAPGPPGAVCPGAGGGAICPGAGAPSSEAGGAFCAAMGVATSARRPAQKAIIDFICTGVYLSGNGPSPVAYHISVPGDIDRSADARYLRAAQSSACSSARFGLPERAPTTSVGRRVQRRLGMSAIAQKTPEMTGGVVSL